MSSTKDTVDGIIARFQERNKGETADGIKAQMKAKVLFEDTGRTVRFGKHDRPVLKLGRVRPRYFVGEMLTMINPSGAGGRVWSARTLQDLEYNVYFHRSYRNGRDGDRHQDPEDGLDA